MSFHPVIVRQSLWHWLALIATLLVVTQVQGAAIRIDHQTPYQTLIPWMQECLTPSTADMPDQLDLSTCSKGRFTPVDARGINHGFTSDVLWLRLSLHNAEATAVHTHLEIGFPQLDDVRLFWKDNGQWLVGRSGDSLPFEARMPQTRLPGFLLHLAPGETREVYLRVASTSSITTPISIASPAALLQHHEEKNIRIGIFYGISIAVIFMAAIFYLLLRETVYLNFFFFIISITGVMLCLDGVGYKIWSHLQVWEQYAIIIFESLAGIFGILFARHFLRSTSTPGTIDLIYRCLIGWFVICLVMAFAAPYKTFVFLVSIACLLLIPVMFIHGVIMSLRRDKPAIMFTAGWSGFFVAGALIFISNLGYAHHMDVSVEYFRLGVELVMLGLSFSLGWRIYEMKEARRIAEAAASTALELSRTRSEFLARMSHELRTPMNGVLGISELLRDTPMSPMQKNYINTLHDSGRHLLDVINDILDFSKLSAGKVELRHEAFCVQDIADDVQSIFSIQADTRNLYYSVETSGTATPVTGDPTWLRQVFINLIGNAFKFTETGGVTVSVRMTPASDNRQALHVDVTDTGRGIPPDAMAQLFQPFTQLDSSTHRSHGGTGLGLAICRQLVELMGGTIGVDSTPEAGSRFWFELTLPVADSLPIAKTTHPGPHDTEEGDNALAGFSVLIAEDNPTNLMILEHSLQKYGMDIKTACNGEEAVQMYCAADGAFDIVLMDCEMPVLSGPDATRRIRAFEQETGRRKVPVIALTAHTAPELVAEFLGAGMTGHLGKPFRQDTLRSLMLQHLCLD